MLRGLKSLASKSRIPHNYHASCGRLHTSAASNSANGDSRGHRHRLPASDARSICKKLCSSTIFLQDGLNISELPILVQNVDFCSTDAAGAASDVQTERLGSHVPQEDGQDDVTQVVAVQEGLKRCNSVLEIFKLLEVIPMEEVVPSVATVALQHIAFLLGRHSISFPDASSSKDHGATADGLVNTFAWRAIVDRLVSIICLTESPRILLDGLKAVVVVRQFTMTEQDDGVLVERLARECMSVVAKGLMSIEDTCHLAQTLQSIKCSSWREDVDQLWPSFVDKSHAIDESNVAAVYATLPLFRRSRHLVHGFLQRRVHDFWWKLKASDVLVIMDTLAGTIRYPPKSFLVLLTKWFGLHIHALRPSEVTAMVGSFKRLDHFDAANVGRTLERYTKARSSRFGTPQSNDVDDPELMASIADFSVHFRYSSPVILDALALWFQLPSHRSASSADQIFRLARAFGILNHVPAAGQHFFAAVEESIESRFVEFRAEDLVELLLACTHVQRYPLNFVRRVFNPFFLDRLNALPDEITVRRATLCLRLLDNAMTLQCPHYKGPMLHTDSTMKTARRDGRLVHIHSWLDDDFAHVLEGRDKFATMKHLTNAFLPDACDFIYNVDENHCPLPFHEKASIHKRKIVVIHLPEDYAVDKRCLLGRQAAHLRHLDRLGYEVVQFDHDTLEALKIRCPGERYDYLRKRLLPLGAPRHIDGFDAEHRD